MGKGHVISTKTQFQKHFSGVLTQKKTQKTKMENHFSKWKRLKIYSRVCKHCGKIFETKCRGGKICEKCHKYSKAFR